ncbi:MAG: hypothetical protein V8Q21_10160 [Akkermansia muciniphila]
MLILESKKDKGLEEVNKRLERKGPVYETFSPDDFNPSEHCCCGKCVKKLLIVMHGTDMSYGTNQNVRAEWGEAGLMKTRMGQQISDVFKNVKIPFCEKCEVELRSCYFGQNDALRTSLQSMFPVKLYYMVRLYLDMDLFMDFSIYIKNYSIRIIFFYK